MPEALHLRAGRAHEAAALSALVVRSKAHWGHDDAFMEQAAPELRVEPQHAANGWVTVAERDGRVVGVAVLRPDLDPPEPESLFVDPAAIGTGAGRALPAAAVAQAAAAGIGELLIEADPNAEPFYRSQGGARRARASRWPAASCRWRGCPPRPRPASLSCLAVLPRCPASLS